MKLLRIFSLGLVGLFLVFLLASYGYTQVVKPLEIRSLISHGCAEYSKSLGGKPSVSSVKKMNHYFGQLARLDSRYLEITSWVNGYSLFANGITSNTQFTHENLAPQLVQDALSLNGFCEK